MISIVSLAPVFAGVAADGSFNPANPMIEYYAQIKLIHIASVLASGGLFALRGALALAGHRLANAAAARWTSYLIDSVLLTTAMMLLAILHLSPLAHAWLGSKLALLPIYIVLGSFALKRARGPRGRWFCFLAALGTYGLMIGIARAHHPLGWARWFGWL